MKQRYGACLTEYRIPHLAMAVLVGLAAGVTPSAAQSTSGAGNVQFGVYDPDGTFANAKDVNIEHIYIPWRDSRLNSLHAADHYAAQRQRQLLITVEPWSWSSARNPSNSELLSGILAGAYDGEVRDVCSTAGSLASDVTLRWGHEMDMKNDRFPWSDWRPADYVAAYRHFVKLCRTYASHAKFMWSPRGEDGLQAYYPGSDYVDVIGLTILGLQKYDVDKYGRALSFAESLRPAYDRVAGYGKPIVVAELGYSGDAAFNEEWATDTRKVGNEFPQLQAVIYFNEVEPHPWPQPYGRPDWRIDRRMVN